MEAIINYKYYFQSPLSPKVAYVNAPKALVEERIDHKGGHKMDVKIAENSSSWTTHWFMLGDDSKIYLDKSFLDGLIRKAIQKAGSQRALNKKLSELGEPFDQAKIYRLKKGEYKGLNIRKVKALLSFLSVPYDSINPSILAVGGRQSVKNVRFPINLNCAAGGKLIAAALSDGGIYLNNLKQRKLVFHYYNKDEDLVKQVIKSVQDLMGDVHYSYKNNILSFSSKIIPDILTRTNTAIGRKTLMDSHLPSVIRYGKPETVMGYFRQVFADEGSVWVGAIEYKRAINLSRFLMDEHLDELNKLDWKEKGVLIKGTKWRCVAYTKKLEENISDNLRNLIWSYPPKLLEEEKSKLEETYGIKAVIRPREINKTKHGYTVVWGSQIFRRNDIKIFAEKIGFGCKRKQGKLDDMLKQWDDKTSSEN